MGCYGVPYKVVKITLVLENVPWWILPALTGKSFLFSLLGNLTAWFNVCGLITQTYTHTHYKYIHIWWYQNTAYSEKTNTFFFLKISLLATTEGSGVWVPSFPIPVQSLKSCRIFRSYFTSLDLNILLCKMTMEGESRRPRAGTGEEVGRFSCVFALFF